MRHFLKYDLVPLLSVAVICAFPSIFMYARNAAEADASQMVPFLLVFLASAAILLLVTLPFFRNVSRAAFWTDLAMLVIINFCLVAEYIKQVIPFLRERYQLVIIVLLLAALFVLLIKKKPDLRTGCLLLLIGFGAMTLVNSVMIVPALITKHRIHQEFSGSATPEKYVISDTVFPKPDRPNVYWFMFDEYGGYENLLHYYNYDNSEFLEDLEDRGFTISNTSRNTEGIFTSTLMTNLLNLNYLVEETDPAEKKAMLRNNCQLYQMFAANGYRINLVNHLDFLGADGCRVLTSNQADRTISVYLLRNCLYDRIPLIRGFLTYYFISDYGASYRAGLDNAMEAGISCWREAEKNGCSTLTVGYYQFPHSPTMVGPNGEELPFRTGWHWQDPSLYLGQVEYCNKFILNLVDAIQEHDPSALIFLCSDHGNRYAMHMLQVHKLRKYDPYEENPYMQNILNAVCYKGEIFDIEGQTGINTMRRVFNQVFGTAFQDVEPVYSYLFEYDEDKW